MSFEIEADPSALADATVAFREFRFDKGEARSLRKWLLGPAYTIVLEHNRRQFETEGRHYGSQWQKLSKMTQGIRGARGFGKEHPILRQTGALFDMATSRAGGKGGKAVPYANEDTLSINFGAVRYGEDHLMGGMQEEPFYTIPKRIWLPPNDGTPSLRRDHERSLAHELERRAAYNLRRKMRRATVTGP